MTAVVKESAPPILTNRSTVINQERSGGRESRLHDNGGRCQGGHKEKRREMWEKGGDRVGKKAVGVSCVERGGARKGAYQIIVLLSKMFIDVCPACRF